MRTLMIAVLALIATSALAQFPPPGIYACVDAAGMKIGTISLLVAGDYQWQTADGASATGQIASAGTSVQALTGPLGEQHWTGSFVTEMGKTSFAFTADSGKIVCQ